MSVSRVESPLDFYREFISHDCYCLVCDELVRGEGEGFGVVRDHVLRVHFDFWG